MLEGLKRSIGAGPGMFKLRGTSLFLGLLAAAALSQSAMAEWDGTIEPLRFYPGDLSLTLDAQAGGAAFGASGNGNSNASGVFKFMPRLARDYDSGWSWGLNAVITANDPLSRGRYAGKVVEKAFVDIRYGLGQLQIGNTDGAGYALAVSGPKVDTAVSLDDAQTTFFRDPSTGRAFTDIFALRSQVGASLNYAKFVYLSPELFGAQLAVSLTPAQSRYGLPFLHQGPQVPGRQVAMWEGAIKYSDQFGPVTISAYGGGAWGRAEHKLPGQEGVSDLGAGLKLDYPLSDELIVSAGGAYRQTNAYAFQRRDQIASAYQAGTTRVMQASWAVNYNAWMLGMEYGNGDADAVAGNPRLGVNAYQGSLGYNFSSSILVSGGWQRLVYQRSTGAFYNALPRVNLDALYLHLNIKTSG
jgi:hypothetical protein